jgi:hypothetical protein
MGGVKGQQINMYVSYPEQILEDLQNNFDADCIELQIYDLFPKEKVEVIAYITRSMEKLTRRRPVYDSKIGMMVDYIVIEPTTNQRLHSQDSEASPFSSTK